MLDENTGQSFLPTGQKEEDTIEQGCKILDSTPISKVHKKLNSPLRSPSKKELKSDVIYETRDNKRIKIEDEIQLGSPFHITRDEYPTENMSYVNSELMSVKPEEEMESSYVNTEYNQNIENGTSLLTDNKVKEEPFSDCEPTDALAKVKDDIEKELISKKFQHNAKTSSDCIDMTIVSSKSAMKSESSIENNCINERSFEYNVNNQLVKNEPELQIEPCFENIQQEQEFKDQYLPLSIKESNFCDESQKANSNYSSSDINDDDKTKTFDPFDHISFVCPECGQCFETRQARRFHLSEQHTELTNPNPFPKFKCKLCDARRVHLSYITNHIRCIHNGEKPFSCTICGLAMASNTTYKTHMRAHKDRLPCDYCKETFLTKRERHTHLKSHLRKQRLACNICGNKFPAKRNLTAHMSVHSKSSFFCSICSSKLASKYTLNEHMMAVHSQDTPYQCTDCDLKFKTPGRMRQHRSRVHKDKLSFQCESCPMKFALRTNLKLHMRTIHNLMKIK